MEYQAGDVIEFQMNLGQEPVGRGLVVDTIGANFRVLPQDRDQLWVIYPQEIIRKVGHVDLDTLKPSA